MKTYVPFSVLRRRGVKPLMLVVIIVLSVFVLKPRDDESTENGESEDNPNGADGLSDITGRHRYDSTSGDSSRIHAHAFTVIATTTHPAVKNVNHDVTYAVQSDKKYRQLSDQSEDVPNQVSYPIGYFIQDYSDTVTLSTDTATTDTGKADRNSSFLLERNVTFIRRGNDSTHANVKKRFKNPNVIKEGNDTFFTNATLGNQRSAKFRHTEVLIFAYMRGGSTFLGDILGKNHNAFYVYEPLRQTLVGYRLSKLEYFGVKQICSLTIAECRNHSKIMTEQIVTFMKRLSSCKLNEIKHIGDKLRVYKGGWKDFDNCTRANVSERNCTPLLMDACNKSPLRVFKAVRLSMDLVSYILDSIRTLKVVFLYRDPRGIMVSRLGMGKLCKDIEKSVPALCHKMYKDVKISKQLELRYPKRFRSFAYENIAMQPMKQIEKLYRFLRFSYSQNDLDRVYNMTHATNVAGESFYNTFREDSKQTASQWVSHAGSPVISLTDKYCGHVYKLLGYPKTKHIVPRR
ncbi:hypothetical protein ScPMuIL_011592 [Solemya velum]